MDGVDDHDQPILINEVLTPDSARFWLDQEYESGRDQPGFDKRYVRDYLQELADKGRWNKNPPGPTLPHEVVRNTMAQYLEAHQALTGLQLNW